ncbi:MAG: hypothetical protein AAGG09_05445, partial [Pseudomonadota bacterium]
MSDGLPPISMEMSGSGAPYVIVDEREATDVATLLQLAPALADPYWLMVRARLINHLATGYEFDVILDPAAFEREYLEQYNSEDPDEAVRPGDVRLRNFGLPPLGVVQPPAMDGDTLVFYARKAFLGLPYKVEVPPGGEPVYLPIALAQEQAPEG